MSRRDYHSISELKKGRYNWNIKVRVLRKWRYGVTATDDKVTPFNLLLLDDKDSRIHAFVGNDVAPLYEPVFKVDSIYTIANFTIKEYQDSEKNLPIEASQQIMLTSYTNVTEVHDNSTKISDNAFDFYDIGDLEQLANQEKYLTDVIGVVQDIQPIHRYVSNKGKAQKYVKFGLTDGRSTVNATIWENYAESFHNSLNEDLERPLIVIISSAKVGYFRGALDVSTWFSHSSVYLNYNHHSVTAMRKKLNQPWFSNSQLSTQTLINDKFFTVAEILKMSEEYIGKRIMSQLIIKKVKSNSNWIMYECTSCQEEVTLEADIYKCIPCNREVEYADIKYRVAGICNDSTGSLALVFKDRDIHRLTNKKAGQLQKEHTAKCFPPFLKIMEQMEITVIVQITEENVRNGSNVFQAVEVDTGHYTIQSAESVEMALNHSTPVQPSTNDDSTSSSYPLEHLTNLNILTPTTVSNTTSRPRNAMPNFNLFSQESD